ncbi:MAG: ankyrin repeat domain-containing protein, partial [Bacteroidota bacterium]
ADSALGPWPPLWLALENGHPAAALLLVEAGANVNSPLKDSISPFHFAVNVKEHDLALTMLAHGADPDSRYYTRRPIHTALMHKNLPLVQALLKAGSRLEMMPNDNEPPLFAAFHNADTSFVYCILRAGADPNATNIAGEPLLHSLIRIGRLEALPIALDIGTDVNIRDIQGRTARDIAVRQELKSVVDLLDQAGATSK